MAGQHARKVELTDLQRAVLRAYQSFARIPQDDGGNTFLLAITARTEDRSLPRTPIARQETVATALEALAAQGKVTFPPLREEPHGKHRALIFA